jgi:hypothetical protein
VSARRQDQRQALKEQIERCTRYWVHDFREVKTFRPSLRAYDLGINRLLGAAGTQARSNAGGHDYDAEAKHEVPGTGLIAFAVPSPHLLLCETPDDNAVDVIVQVGLFGGVVFG